MATTAPPRASSARSPRLSKIASSLAIAGLALSSLTFGIASPAHAATVYGTVDGIRYSGDDTTSTASVVFYDTAFGTDVTIPEKVTLGGDEYTVTEIDDWALHEKGLTSISLPDTLVSIGLNAFFTHALTELTIPDSVITIGHGAFANGTLASLTLGASVVSIGDGAFMLNALQSATIPDAVTAIGQYAFQENALTSVTIGDSVTSIGALAFAENALTSVTIGDPVTSIGESAFEQNALTSVTIGDSVTSIGEWAFHDNALTSLALPNSVTTVGMGAFATNALTAIALPSSISTIEPLAFRDNALASVTIPESVTAIGERAFEANALTSLTIPDLVTEIGEGAFSGNRLTSLTIPDAVTNIGAMAFSDNALASLTIGASVRTIGSSAFAGNPLTSVSIPDGVTGIGDRAFAVTDLSSVAFEGGAPMTFTPGTGEDGSLGTADGLVVSYLKEFAHTGFSSPTWQGYDARETVTATFDTRGGSTIRPVIATVGLPLPLPDAPIRPNFAFAGWHTDTDRTDLYDHTTVVTDHITLYAEWNPVHTVTFRTTGGSTIAAATVTDGETLSAPTDPTRTRSTFTGWYTDEEATAPYDFTTEVVGDLTLHAGWAPVHTITFDTDEGTSTAPARVNDGDLLIIPEPPTRAGFTFTGWYTDEDATAPYDVAMQVTGDLTLYAGWSPVHTVTFHSTGGSTIAAARVADGDALAAPADPVRAGFTFTGWHIDGDGTTPYDFTATVAADLTLFAGWTPVTHTITFDATGGSIIPEDTVREGAPTTAPEAPARTGYTFSGWFTDEATTAAYDFTAAVTADLTLYAGWVPVSASPDVVDPSEELPLATTGGAPSPWASAAAALLLLASGIILLARRSGTPAQR